MTLLSDIYDVTLKLRNRGANKEGYYRPTLSEFFMTDHDFMRIEKINPHVKSASMLEIESTFPITTGETVTRAIAFDGVNLISGGYNTDKVYIHQGLTQNVQRSFDAPAGYTYSMCFNQFTGDLLLTDNLTDDLYIIDMNTGAVKNQFALPNDDTTAIALDNNGNLMWCGKYGNSFTVFNGVSNTVLYELDFGSSYNIIGDMAFDGTNLIIISRSTNALCVFDGISTNLLYSKILYDCTYPTVTWAGNRIVTANGTTDLIYLHNLE